MKRISILGLDLSAIKNVGDAAIKNILECKKSGDFKSFEDFCERAELSTINKKTIESLIKAGAMDNFNINRAQLLSSYQDIIDIINKEKETNRYQDKRVYLVKLALMNLQ